VPAPNAKAITGDVGVSPIAAGAITGFDLIMDDSNKFSTSAHVTGRLFAPEYFAPTGTKLTTAVSDMLIAYNDAAARPVTSGPFAGNNPGETQTYTNLGKGEIGGLTLTPGVYTYDVDVKITDGNLIFDGNGDADSVFIIRTSKSVLQAAGTEVILAGSAKAENIYWSVAQLVEVGAGAHMKGILLVFTAVKFITGSSFIGRVLSSTAVTIQAATIAEPTTLARRGLRGVQVA
jgi:hypothetical protein